MTTYYYCGRNNHTFVLRTDGPDVSRGLAHTTQYNLLLGVRSKSPLEVCSVTWVKKSKPKDEDELLSVLSKLDAPAANGGWRNADQDLVCLKVANFDPIAAMSGRTDLDNTTFLCHPAVQGGLLFTFPDGITIQAVSLMRMIYDLRRFVDPEHTRRKFLLREAFRVSTPTHFFNIVDPERPITHDDILAKMVLDAWYEQPLNEEPHETERANSPRAFLFKKYRDTVGEMGKHHDKTHAVAYGLWKATAAFCDFLQLTWQSGLRDKTFDPVPFFGDEKTSEEFSNFINRVDKGLDISRPDAKDSLD